MNEKTLPGNPGYEGIIRRRYTEGHLTAAERDARVALHRALRVVRRAREAGRSLDPAERAEVAAGLGVES